MRYFTALLITGLILLSACTMDDGDDTTKKSATATVGQDLIIDIGVARLQVPAATIGTGAGQLPPGTKVTLTVSHEPISGRDLYSPTVEISSTVSGLALSPPAQITFSYDAAKLDTDNKTLSDTRIVKQTATATEEYTFTTLTPVTDSEFTEATSPSRVETFSSSFGNFTLGTGSGGGGGGAPLTNLTGTIQTVLTSTVFNLADSGSTIATTLAIPTSDASSIPAVLTLNDATFDAGNPLDPNNRIVTVVVGGVTYTSDEPAAGVAATISSFNGTDSAGTLVGTVIEQGATASLSINYTWTTGAVGAVVLTGTVTDLAGRRTLNLADSGSSETVLILMPDTLPDVGLNPITFDDASYDSGNPLDANGRLITVAASGDNFSSDVPVVGNVTITFTAFSAGVSTGTITGTVVSATPATKTLNYTFTTTAGGGGGGAGTFAAGTPVDITTTDTADESAVVFDGTDYIGIWLSDTGTTNRTLEFMDINASTLAAGTQKSIEPSFDLDPTKGFDAAIQATSAIMVVGTGDSSGDAVIATIFNFTTGASVAEINVGAGLRPRVVFNSTSGNFVISYQDGADVKTAAYTPAGTQVGATATSVTASTLQGMASSSGDEVLITGDDGSGLRGQYFVPSTGALSGSGFDISTVNSGGMCAWDVVGSMYLVATQAGTGFITQVVLGYAASATTAHASTLTLPALAAPTQAVGGNAGTVFADAAATLWAMETASGPAFIGTAIVGQLQSLNVDTTTNGAPMANNGAGGYIMLAAKGTGGVTAIPLTIS
ncbi:MAG: hypothetical protein L3J82_01855 [Planctomycetes bacterium]|nr:hypothetical protein [Planctomycetota bacterium]